MFKNRKFQYGTSYSIIIAFFIAGVIIVNFIMTTLADKITTSVDLTANKVFNLTDDSKKFLSSLKQDVEIIVLSDEDEFESISKYTTQANKVIKHYAQSSDKVKITYVDPTKNPTYLSEYKNEQIDQNSVIVKSGSKHDVLSVSDLFDIQQDIYSGGAKIVASKAESAVTSAILFVTSEAQTKIALIKGYSEASTSGVTQLLKKNNFEVVEVSILSDNIPMDAEAVIIFGPGKDYDDIGIEKIKTFMENDGNKGKNLFVMLNCKNQTYTRLNELLNEYGLKVERGIVFETSTSRRLGDLFNYVSSYADEEYFDETDSESMFVQTPFSMPIEILEENNVKCLLETSSASGIVQAGIDLSTWKVTKDDLTGPITTGAVSSKNDSHVFLFGSCFALDETVIARSSVNNSDFFLKIFNTMRSESDDIASSIEINPVSLEDKTLGINMSQSSLLMTLFVIIVPVAVIITGVSVVLVRRNKSRRL